LRLAQAAFVRFGFQSTWTAVLIVLIVPLLATGCGGSEDRFSGSRDLPDGFEITDGPGASFGRPAGWIAKSTQTKGSPMPDVSVKAPAPVAGVTPGIQLVRAYGKGSFDTTLDARRSFVADTGENRTEDKPEDVAVSGAERGVLFRNTTSFGDTRFDEFDLAILLKDGSKIFFSGIVPSGGDVEADAILESFRLAGG